MARRALLDVNLLVALLDSHHEHHRLALQWFAMHAPTGWASCPLTRNGVVRILANPGYRNPRPIAAVVAQLRPMLAHPSHTDWPEDVSVTDQASIDATRLTGHQQLTDACLLALAVRNGGRLVTLDRAIPMVAVPGALRAHLETLR